MDRGRRKLVRSMRDFGNSLFLYFSRVSLGIRLECYSTNEPGLSIDDSY